jgi:FkbH-like protein
LSIASKNNHDEAKAALQKIGIWDLFLYPQINWDPKSANIRRIVERLNIGMDAVAFIDDSEFERAEVAAALPAVRTLSATEFAALPACAEFAAPVTEESRGRRRLYRDEETRQTEFAQSHQDYEGFLASCGMRAILGWLDAGNRERVYELVQRTNQLNYSGTRYSRADLDRLLGEPGTVPVAIRCEDRFGSYGIVGFAVLRVEDMALRITDLMFSCRIQGKRIEHSFFAFLQQAAAQGGLARLVCRFKRSARNAPAAQVFADLGFALVKMDGPAETYALEVAPSGRSAFPATVVDEMGLAEELKAK